MNKKAIATEALVWMILGLVALLVLLGVTKVFSNVFEKVTGKNECEIEFLISHFTKTGGAEIIAPECEPHKITVTSEDLSKGRKDAVAILEKYRDSLYGNQNFKEYYDYYHPYIAGNDQTLNEWAVNEIIAKEMKYCWDVTGRGKLNLFSDWWSLLQCRNKQGGYDSCSKEEVYKLYGLSDDVGILGYTGIAGLAGVAAGVGAGPALVMAGTVPLIIGFLDGDIQAKQAPTFCVLCSRIKFDPSINSPLPGDVTSLGQWLANNPVAETPGDVKSKIAYSQYISNDAFEGILANENSYPYSTNEAYAVLYARVNVFKGKDLIEKAGYKIFGGQEDNLPDALQTIKLVQYGEIKNHCTYLVG